MLAAKLGSKAEPARELAYWLYNLCERKKWAKEALSYNGLVQSWPEIMRLAKEGAKGTPVQGRFGEEEERNSNLCAYFVNYHNIADNNTRDKLQYRA